MSQIALDRLKERFGDAITETHSRLGDDTAIVARDRIFEILTFLRDDPALLFNMCSDVTCVDYFGREPRFEVVYHLYSITKKKRVRVKVPLAEDLHRRSPYPLDIEDALHQMDVDVGAVALQMPGLGDHRYPPELGCVQEALGQHVPLHVRQ